MRPHFFSAGVQVRYFPARCPMLNPEEKLNGWLRGELSRSFERGEIDRDRPLNAVYFVLRRAIADGTMGRICASWIDYLFSAQALGLR